ncbi:hypothetical protein FEP15_03341 [Burkholderia multivorans]|nr:hypothetical protein [Burkholderia multivorans]
MQRPVAGRRGRAGPRTRAARVAARIPRIACQRMKARRRGADQPEVRHRRLADEYRARLAQPCRRRRIVGSRRQFRRRAAERHRHAARRDVFLDRHRHAVERTGRFAAQPARFRGARHRECAVAIERIGRADQRLPFVDARQHGLRDIDGRQRLAAIAVDERRGTEFMERSSRHEFSMNAPNGAVTGNVPMPTACACDALTPRRALARAPLRRARTRRAAASNARDRAVRHRTRPR